MKATKRSTVRCILLLLTLTIVVIPISQANGTVRVQVNDRTVTVQIDSRVDQNITTVPRFRVYYGPNNSSAFSGLVRSAVSDLQKDARIEGFSLNVTSTGAAILFLLRFNISEVFSTRGGVTTVDTAWKSFNVSSELTSLGNSLNRVGEAYFLSPILEFMNRSPAPGVSIRAFLNDRGPRNIQDMTAGTKSIIFLDMSAFSTPLSQMDARYVQSENKTSWSSGLKETKLRILETEQQPPFEPVTLNYLVTYQNQLEASVRGRAIAVGDKIIIDGSSFEPALMLSVIIALGTLLIVTTAYDRRLTSGRGGGSSSRGKRQSHN